MSFLSFPPPSLPGSHHVFQQGPRFPGTTNTLQPGIFQANAPGNPGMMTSVPFATSPPSGNMISHVAFTSNAPIAALSAPPPPISPMWTPTSFNQTQPQIFSNGSPNFSNSGNFSNNSQQASPKVNAQNLNPWAPVSANNFQPTNNNGISPWAINTPNANGSFNSFGNGANNSNQNGSTLQNSVAWGSDSYSNDFSSTPVHIKESPSKFRQSKSPACDINPWAQPPTLATGSNNFQMSNDRGRQNQHNFSSNKFDKANFNHRRGNSRHFSNDNRNHFNRQERSFKTERNFKRESNVSKPFSCDTCDRACYSELELQDHMAEHIKCNFKNCQFEAHPKIVALHKRMQHDTGYAEAISKLKNSDEIEKWRAERRRRFPTAANILKRKAEQAEKEARGEVIENKEFGKFKKQNTGEREPRNRFANRKRSKKSNRNNRLRDAVIVADSGSDSDDDSHIKLRRFCGVLAAENTDVLEATAEGTNVVDKSAETLEEPIENGILENSGKGNLDLSVQEVAKEELTLSSEEREGIERNASSNPINIESDDDAPIEMSIVKENITINNATESDDESPIEIPVSKIPLSETSNSTVAVNNLPPVNASKGDTDSDDSPVEIPFSKVPLSENSNSTNMVEKTLPLVDARKCDRKAKMGRNSKDERHKKNGKERKHEPQFDNHVKKSSLLEKLLADDIRHERNVIMQCIRHVVKKKFFGIGASA